MLAWMPMLSDTWPMTGRNTAMPGMAKTEIVENEAARTRAGATIETRAKKAGASVPMDAARSACMATATATLGA